AVAARDPEAAAFPSGVRIVDAAVEALRVEAERIGHAQRHELAVDERVHAVEEIPGRDRHVFAEPERVVLIDPGVVARLDTLLGQALEAGAGESVEAPALGAMVAGRFRPVQRTFALAPVERSQVSAAERDPDDAVS